MYAETFFGRHTAQHHKHLLQPISIKVSIKVTYTAVYFFYLGSLVILYIVHVRLHGYSANTAYKWN